MITPLCFVTLLNFIRMVSEISSNYESRRLLSIEILFNKIESCLSGELPENYVRMVCNGGNWS